MIGAIKRLLQDEEGTTVVEYGILTALVLIGVLAAVPHFSDAYIAFSQKVGGIIGAALP